MPQGEINWITWIRSFFFWRCLFLFRLRGNFFGNFISISFWFSISFGANNFPAGGVRIFNQFEKLGISNFQLEGCWELNLLLLCISLYQVVGNATSHKSFVHASSNRVSRWISVFINLSSLGCFFLNWP